MNNEKKQDDEKKSIVILGTISKVGNKEGEFKAPSAVCFTKNDHLVVADFYNHRLQIFDEQLNLVRTNGREGQGEGEFNRPSAVCMGKNDHSDLILIADQGNNRVQVVTMEGVFVHSFPCPKPHGVCVDEKNNVFVSSWINAHQVNEEFQIVVFSWQGTQPIRTIGTKGMRPAQLNRPEHLCFSDEHSQLSVCDSLNHRIQVFTPEGELIRAFGSQGQDILQFKEPTGICLDKNGALLISDYYNHRIVAYKWDGKQEKLLGAFGKKGQAQGEFNNPFGVCVDSKNRLAVADRNNHRVQVLDILSHRLSLLCCLLLP